MANHASAEKKFRRDQRRRVINIARTSRVRTFVKKMEEALKKGISQETAQAFRQAQSELMRGATKGIMHKKTASRKISRLAMKLNATTTS